MQSLRAYISLSTVERNARLVQKRAGVPLIAVVKDDAYGHGAERVALALNGIASAFAVATVSEGAALRVAGVEKDVLVLSPCLSEEEVLSCARYRLTPSASSFAALRLLGRAARSFGLPLNAQLAVNTGMNRYGVPPGRAKAACREAKELGIRIDGVFSHFYDPADVAAREEQFRLFSAAAEDVKGEFPAAVRHLSATGGILAGRKYDFDAVRSGIALYGYLPEGFEGALPVRPALRLSAAVSQRGKFTGGGAGYARAEREYGALHTLRLGYGDGFFRAGGVGIGKLCMDAAVAEGDAPFASRRTVPSDIGEYARAQGTSVYEALVRLTQKAEKIYV